MFICLNRGTTGGNLSLEQFVRLSSDAGFHGADVDLSYAISHGTAALKDLYARHHQRFGAWGPAADHRTPPEKRAEALKTLAQHAEVARDLGIDSCATWTLPSSDLPFMECWKQHVDGLKPVAKVLADHGLRFGLEFVSPYHLRRAHKHEFIYTPGLMLELADAIGPNVGLLVDCWHVYNSGTPWKQLAEIPKRKIVLCHLNDAPGGPVENLQDGKRLLPGEGVLDLPAFFAAIKQQGYDGPVSLEAFNSTGDLPPEQAARRAWEATSRVLSKSGLS